MCLYLGIFFIGVSIGTLLWYKIRAQNICPATNTPYPPGPKGFPILGFMPFLSLHAPLVLTFLGYIYGNIFSIFLGNYRVIVLNDHNVIREALREDVFSGRPDLKMLEVRSSGVRKGLVCSEGKDWAEQRKFTMRLLKDFGFGKQTMECLVQEEVDKFIVDIRKELNKPISLKNRFKMAVLNAIWKITCGECYEYDDQRLQNILAKTGADLAETQYTGPVLFLPWLIDIVPGLTRWNDFVNSVNSSHTFLLSKIAEHKLSVDHTNPRDFIDAYLLKIEKTTDPNSSFYGDKGEHSLLIVLLDLFMAGADTTSTTLLWAFLYMILYENVQKKVQEELDSVLGNQIPQIHNRKILPYTEATIMEVLRKSSLVPMGLFHSTITDTQFRGYHIPKDSVIIANIYNVLNNKAYWGDPQNFRPERFLDSNNQIKKYDEFLPFSTGKRACPGENLARDELFLFFAGLLQQFSFKIPENQKRPTEKPQIGVISTPKPYDIVITQRQRC